MVIRGAMRARTTLATLLVVSAVLVLIDVRDSGAVAGMRGLAASVIGPMERAVGALASPFVSGANSVLSFSDETSRSGQVARDQANLSDSPAAAGLAQAERAELEALLRSSGAAGLRFVPARVVAYGMPQRFTSGVTVDVGSSSGIAADMAVVTGAGLVGLVTSVGPNTATVQLISDADTVVAVRDQKTLQAGALTGTGLATQTELQLLDATVPLSEGDRIVTFGSTGARPYPGGIAVGTVVGFRGDVGQADRVALVRPAATLTALDIVGVIVPDSQSAPRAVVAPPKSAASASPSALADRR